MTTKLTGVSYIAGRPLDIGDRHYEPGDSISGSEIAEIPYLEAFVSAGYIYLIHGVKGYETLPPHLYSIMMTRAEAKAQIAGDPSIALSQQQEASENFDSDPSQVRSLADSILSATKNSEEGIAEAETLLRDKGISITEVVVATPEPEVEPEPETPKPTARKTAAKG